MQRYCSEACQAEAKRARVMQKNNLFKVAQPLMKIQHQEYLTFSKAAILMGCSRQYIYKLVALGKLKASRISNRMAFIRRADIEQMLEGNPYHRILPGSTFVPRKSASSSLPTKREIREKESDEVLDFYSGEEVMTLFKVKQSWLYTSAKRNHIPICRIAGKNYYSKKHIDEFFGVAVDISGITDWLLTEEVEELFGMKPTALRAFTYRHKIPTKREYGRTYYSKSHLDELRRTDLVNDERYYTVEQVQQIYGLSSANICHIVKVKHIEKIKVGVKNLLLRSDVERVMAERNKQP
jgi:DNA binding domain, excisionase family